MKTMKTMKTIVLLSLSVLFVTSCTVEKRLYNKGFHVEWKKKYRNADAEELAENNNLQNDNITSDVLSSKRIQTTPSNSQVVTDDYTYNDVASNSDEIQLKELGRNENLIDFNSPTTIQTESKIKENENCDVIILKNGDEIEAKVLEVGTEEIKYKSCDNPDGPTFTIKKSDVFKIKYSNGTSTVMNNDEDPNSNSSGGKGKSQIIALVLVLLVGVLGIHRFYLGHIGIGVLMLLTGGVCGILALIDLIRIITGDLKPKDGEYTETF